MKYFFFLVVFTTVCFSELLVAQSVSLKGVVTDRSGVPLPNVRVALKETILLDQTDEKGRYELPVVPFGNYVLMAYLYGYEVFEVPLEISRSETSPVEFSFSLTVWEEAMDEIVITTDQAKTFGITRLNAVQDFAINEGKKTEVIELGAMTVNAATNNARQVYAKVAGLNIWESDGAGLQLGIGGRGLNPNRTSNFNTRQNGYDISADALGYPESYYTPPVEALSQIQIIRGAASLQYGTQFGGLLNFKFKEAPEKDVFKLRTRQTAGPWGFRGSFNEISGSTPQNTFSYYGYYHFKGGNGFRDNSDFDYHNAFASVSWKPTESWTIKAEFTKMYYLAQQAGGLTDRLFLENPRQSVRDRNWFQVDWNLAAVHLTYAFNAFTQINARTFGLLAERQSLGNLERINVADFGENRTFIDGQFENIGNETRLVHRYSVGNQFQVLAVGMRFYRGNTFTRQGDGNNGSGPDFTYLNPDNLENSDYHFPNLNVAFFAEHIIQLNEKWSLTPGIRYEIIQTQAEGYYKQRVLDAAGNIIIDNRIDERQRRSRSLLLAGLGMSYKPGKSFEVYANISQNYRAINFTDLRVVNPNFVVDPDIEDERGWTADWGVRGSLGTSLSFDATIFYLRYEGKIGQVLRAGEPPLFNDFRFRGNISDARTYGIESLLEWNLSPWLTLPEYSRFSLFSNIAFIDARYINTQDTSIRDKFVEMVPPVTIKLGVNMDWKAFRSSIQWGYTAEHFSDATNARRTSTAVEGVIPAYQVVDISASYEWSRVLLEMSVNNALNESYFTRRASAYPGPGIIPADGRAVYATLQFTL